MAAPCLAQTNGGFDRVELPAPASSPLDVSNAADPVLGMARNFDDSSGLISAIRGALRQNPRVGQSEARVAEFDALRDVQEMSRVPDVFLTLQGREVFAREFSNDPDNVLERSRARGRTDATFQIQQTLIDFGATTNRIEGAKLRVDAAEFELEAARTRIALQVIASWYEIFAYRMLIDLETDHIGEQVRLGTYIDQRIAQGVTAETEKARVDSTLALARGQLARYRRLAASAEARFLEYTGTRPPRDLGRAPPPSLPVANLAEVEQLARSAPFVRAAQVRAEAAARDARAARADRLPQLSAGIEGGRYGLFDTDEGEDYDVRGVVTLRQSFFTGAIPQARASEARAIGDAAEARAVEDEAVREASIGYSDLEALDAELAALETGYVAARTTRDAVTERFAALRGDLLNVLQSEDEFVSVAASYLQTLVDRDTARYALLARMGVLLDTIGIEDEEFSER